MPFDPYEKLTVGSLFSGIGGLELGLERTGGFHTIWNSEIDPYANAVLRKHWPDVPNLGDITKIDWAKIAPPLPHLWRVPVSRHQHRRQRRGHQRRNS